MRRPSARAVVIGLLVAALVVAGLLSFFASSSPDGLERVAEDKGIAQSASEHDLQDGPLADYQTTGVEDEWLSTGLSGVIGVLVVAGVSTGLFLLLRPRSGSQPEASPERDVSSASR
ncbi:PDGLE domain-containing protein [Blastococcus sp. Marseille-P5729]|uniref:PDGLE domain-containing protein n=1 Tax=Blastococcus sp. Marseille-P5729 TaxID=2086582 RepID=UPI0018FE2AE5|nr:PDGLE domain-containing protein [Blastococcus sp. Marseille-P5729]